MLPAASLAQSTADPPPRGGAAASASAAALPPYQSAFEAYRAWRDEPMEPWREVNDRVRRVGGHAGVLKAGSDEAPAQSAPHSGKPADAPAGGGHRHAH